MDYSPARHSYFRMLYDWNTIDFVSGQTVSAMADADLSMLSQNGFNLVHLYLWDQLLLQESSPGGAEYSGFLTPPADPSTSPNGQWQNLNDFVTRAEKYGLFVALHFVSGYPTHELSTNPSISQVQSFASQYISWATEFIRYINVTNGHKNVLVWGMEYALEPAVGSYCPAPVNAATCNNYSLMVQLIYNGIHSAVAATNPPAGVGLVGVDLGFGLNEANDNIIVRPGAGYPYNWTSGQQTAYTVNQLLGTDPDIWLAQIYTANAGDMESGLSSLTTSNAVSGGKPIPISKIYVVESATSSALNSSPNGTNLVSWGDANTPTTTTAGQDTWLNNVLCRLQIAGLTKYTYWSLYDPVALWTSFPWSESGVNLSWSGYWGLDYQSSGQKPSFSMLASYYKSNSLSCPLTLGTLAIVPESTFYTYNQPIRISFNQSDLNQYMLNGAPTYGITYACGSGGQLASYGMNSTSVADASCGFYDQVPTNTTGTVLLSLKASTFAPTASASGSVTIGPAPTIAAVTNQNYTTPIHTTDWVVLWGNGFSGTGGNTVTLSNGTSTYTFNESDGLGFWDQSYTQVNAQLGGRVPAGTWTVKISNGWSSQSSAGFQITIVT